MARSRAMVPPLDSPRARVRSRLLAVTAAVALAGIVAGCGLRFETPAQVAPTPGANEIARQRASADSLGLAVLADAPAADPADPLTPVRAAVVAQARAHLEQLGAGDSTPTADTSPPGEPSPAESSAVGPSPVVPPTAAPTGAAPDVVVAQLALAAGSARADAASVPDGPLARLLGSVSTARLLAARQLAGAAALEPPALPPAAVPATAPAGPSPSALRAVVAAEDEAGYGYEVIAAKLSGGARTSALDRAAVHRTRADGWAALLSIAHTGLDPRRSAYALPAGLDDPAVATALAQTLELSLASTYASLVADAEPASRAGLLDALTDAAATAVACGAPVPSFPGLPERSVG